MKALTAALLASAFIAGPALACGWNKSAEQKSLYTAEKSKVEEAMTTYDPAKKPVFEDEAEKADLEIEPEAEEKAAE